MRSDKVQFRKERRGNNMSSEEKQDKYLEQKKRFVESIRKEIKNLFEKYGLESSDKMKELSNKIIDFLSESIELSIRTVSIEAHKEISDLVERMNVLIEKKEDLENELDKSNRELNEQIRSNNNEGHQWNLLNMKKDELITELQLQLAKSRRK